MRRHCRSRMDKRLVAGVLVAVLAAACMYSCREKPPTALDVPVTTTPMTPNASVTAEPVHQSTIPDSVPISVPGLPPTASSPTAAPTTIDDVPPTAVAPVAVALASIHGVSHPPTTGKPVAAVTVDWNLQPDPAHPGRFTGTIGAINQAGQALVTLSVEVVGEVALGSPARISAPALGRGERVEVPVLAQLQPGTAAAELVVTVRVEAASVRSRVVSIPIRRPAVPAASEKTSATTGDAAQGQPLQGEQTLTGSDGQAVHFMPAAGQK